jgi:hypothetical protein
MVDRAVARAREANADAMSTLDEIIGAGPRAAEAAAEFARVWNQISAQAQGVGDDVDGSKSRLEAHWTGDAATRYFGIVGDQSQAARRSPRSRSRRRPRAPTWPRRPRSSIWPCWPPSRPTWVRWSSPSR